ncbi:MAG: hypothetical protein IJV66_05935 [Firmicutes bacterium]|nr:hypothetical protein [Bacillota bacterium]
MKEARDAIKPVAEFLAYKIRAGEISVEGGDVLWKMILKNPDKAQAIIDILEMDLPEADTIKRIERLTQ